MGGGAVMTLRWRPGYTWNETIWNPSMISTALWLDAADASTITESGGAVSQWDDKSGNGRNAIQLAAASQPNYSATGLNSLPAIDFDGTCDELALSTVAGLASVSQSLFIVAKRDNAAGRTEIPFSVGNTQFGDGVVDIPRWTDNIMYSQVGRSGNRPTPFSVITDSPYINAITGGVIQKSYTNGLLMGTGTTQSQSDFAISNGGYVGSGRAVSNSLRFFDGKISEIVLVPSVATLDLRQRIEGYLAHKWGLTANLPADHPYKLVGPTP